MFSPADYELAARLTGLPVPRTPAEQAAAAPTVAAILRSYHRAPAAMPGFDGEQGMNTSATRSLNPMPDVAQPEAKIQLERRLQAGVEDPDDMAQVAELLMLIDENPQAVEELIMMLEAMNEDGDASAEYLSQQRPVEYDMPNYGGQYSMLNAPSSSSVPPSVRYQSLG